MRDHLKNPNLYYVAVPVVACLWVLFVSTISLRGAHDRWTRQKREWDTSRGYILDIVKLDPDRIKYKVEKDGAKDFDYSEALDQIAQLCGVSSSNYSISGGKAMKTAGQNKKTSNVTIRTIGIETLANFVSQMLLRWPNLECDTLSITKLKTAKDAWKATLKFTYTYD